MNRYIKVISAILAAVPVFGASAFAVSLSIINANMAYRTKLIKEPEFKVYVKTHADNYPYYGAKFEPRSGIYIGTPYNKHYPGIDNAADTQYHWFVPTDEIRNENCARAPIPERKSGHTTLTGINFNFALKNNKVIDIRDYSNWLYNKIDEFASWGHDILLIFGKEMNIDANFSDGELFKDCFRFVADYAHTKENIAMVWAPNDMGGLDTTFEEFWPGDEYVDWVGCSLYTMPYFQGKINGVPGGNLLFAMHEYANPSIHAKMIHQFMVENGIKKPVMITEGGVGFESPDGVDYTDWAKTQLKMYYSDICRIYPEFKCIISFNEYVDGDLYRYDMSNNPELLDLMKRLTSDPIYLKSYPSSSSYSFMELFDGMIFTDRVEVSAYAYVPTKQQLVVRYLIDGEWISEKTEPPYAISLGSEYIPYGEHTLTCEVYNGERITESRSYEIALAPADGNYAYADITDNGDCPFADMAWQPAETRNAAAFLAEAGILTGIDEINFAPDRKISRAETAAILTRLTGMDESEKYCGLTDVSPDDWYYGIINSAVNHKLITGYPDNTFRGAAALSRTEFAVMIAKLLERCGADPETAAPLSYTDDVPDWAADFVRTAKAAGVLLDRADGIFYGSGYVGRGDAAVMIKRLYDVIY